MICNDLIKTFCKQAQTQVLTCRIHPKKLQRYVLIEHTQIKNPKRLFI